MHMLDAVARSWNLPEAASAEPVDKEWKGTAAHMKVDREISRQLWGLNGAALELLQAGAVLWTYERLRQDPAATPLAHLAEALFARQASPLYLRPIEAHRFFPQTDGASLAVGATALLTHLVFTKVCAYPHIRAIGPVILPTSLSLGVAKYVMPKGSRAFGTWLSNAVEVLRERASLPGPVAPPAKEVSATISRELSVANTAAPFAPLALHTRLSVGITPSRTSGVKLGTPEEVEQAARAFGEPLSPWLLAKDRRAQQNLDEVLRAIDPAENPFLYSTDELRALGLADPYRYADVRAEVTLPEGARS